MWWKPCRLRFLATRTRHPKDLFHSVLSGPRTLWGFSPFLQWRGRRCVPNESEGCFLIQSPGLYPQKHLDICNPEVEGYPRVPQ